MARLGLSDLTESERRMVCVFREWLLHGDLTKNYKTMISHILINDPLNDYGNSIFKAFKAVSANYGATADLYYFLSKQEEMILLKMASYGKHPLLNYKKGFNDNFKTVFRNPSDISRSGHDEILSKIDESNKIMSLGI
tara:strand:- start:313 stop:726 length:414 start_codon:yes stop_codon:yes gene_type:complete